MKKLDNFSGSVTFRLSKFLCFHGLGDPLEDRLFLTILSFSDKVEMYEKTFSSLLVGYVFQYVYLEFNSSSR